jgi:hypothetical protein
MSMADKIRAMAMRDEGISDDQMLELQGEKLIRQHLEETAARDGGAAAIRAAMRPRGARRPAARAMPAGRDVNAVRAMMAKDLAAEEALGEQNMAGIRAAEQRAPGWSGPPGMGAPGENAPGAIGGAMMRAATPPGRRPLMSEPAAPAGIPPEVQQVLQQAIAAKQEAPPSDDMMMQALQGAPAAAPQIAPEEAQGLMQMIMSLFRGGGAPAQAAAPRGNPWTGPASMQGGALSNIQQGMGRR